MNLIFDPAVHVKTNACPLHPQWEGIRYKRNYYCVGCQRDARDNWRKSKKREPAVKRYNFRMSYEEGTSTLKGLQWYLLQFPTDTAATALAERIKPWLTSVQQDLEGVPGADVEEGDML